MASGTIKNYQSAIKYKVVQFEEFTIDGTGWKDMRSYKPTGMNNFLFAHIWHVNSTSQSPRALLLFANGEWLGGIPNETVNGLVVRYFYTD